MFEQTFKNIDDILYKDPVGSFTAFEVKGDFRYYQPMVKYEEENKGE